MRDARIAPLLLGLDGGSVLIIGGQDGDGQPVGSVERFRAESRDFETLTPRLPAFENLTATRLPGERVGLCGCGLSAGDQCQVMLLLPEPDGDFSLETLELPLAEVGLHGLEALHAAALADGRMLVSGHDPATDQPAAFLVDIGRNAVRSLAAAPARASLLALSDGVIASLDPDGAGLQRHVLQSPFDDPAQGLLAPATLGVALDSPTRWDFAEVGLTAVQPNARLDVPGLVFADVRIELVLIGNGQVLLTSEGSEPLVIEVTETSLTALGCGFPRGDGAIVIVRRGDRLEVDASGSNVGCELDSLPAHVGVGLRLEEAATVASFTLRRL